MRKVEFEHGVMYNGDCLEVMPDVIEDHSVDMILADLPYGVTACKWDSTIEFSCLWPEYKRIVKKNKAVVLTGSQPFTTFLISSNYEMFRYNWIWNKKLSGSFQNAKFRPLQITEDVCVFSNGTTEYHPIMRKGQMRKKDRTKKKAVDVTENYKGLRDGYHVCNDYYYPTNLIDEFPNTDRTNKFHPTQKPVELFQYLILTYTSNDDIVLDNVIGSGTTAIAAYNTGRRWIGIEEDPDIFDMACERIENETKQQNMFNMN